jgi:hypothetical protein
MNHVFATANVIDGRQVLCYYAGKVDFDVYRVRVMAYDEQLREHLEVPMDFPDPEVAFVFFESYKTDESVRVELAGVLNSAFRTIMRKRTCT